MKQIIANKCSEKILKLKHQLCHLLISFLKAFKRVQTKRIRIIKLG